MRPRGRLDIGWSDFLFAAAAGLAPRGRRGAERRLERLWSDAGDTLACLSVRSGLDLLLTAQSWPEGSEVLVSAVTIRDMVRIIEHHRLVPVPVDIDMSTLTVSRASLERAVSPRTRALLVAHLFGSRMPLEEAAAFTRERGLLLVEDCAQSFTGLDDRGHPGSDVTLFSFGPIKTATALGGALLRVRDARLRDRMKAVQAAWPLQSRASFLRRLARFLVLRGLMMPLPFTLFCGACRLLGRSHDDVISQAVRGFSGPDLLANIRRRPSYPLLALLHRRLARFRGEAIARRAAAGAALRARLPAVPMPGREAARHSYWTFPVESERPDELVRRLWSHGFDATRGRWSLFCVPAPGGHTDREPAQAQEAMRRIVYLPVPAGLSPRDLERLAGIVGEAAAGAAEGTRREGPGPAPAGQEAAPAGLRPGGGSPPGGAPRAGWR